MTLPSLDFRDPVLLDHSLVISASAGSGKTFALVALVLGFLGQGGSAPEVVATTFGREASADLRARILLPLDQMAGWTESRWRDALDALEAGWETWDAWLGALDPAVRPEIGAAARQWFRPEGTPPWASSPAAARVHWTRTRREAELLQASTVHALAQAVLRRHGLVGEAVKEADDPDLVRLLRAAGREALHLPDGDPDHAAARRLWTWCEGVEEGRDRWHLLAVAFDAHLDALGTWRESTDAAGPRHRFLTHGRKVLDAYTDFAAQPSRAAAITQQGKPNASFAKYGLRCFQPDIGADASEPELLDALERLATRFLKDDGTGLPNYYADAFHEALAPLLEDLPEALETWMTLLIERVFQQFRILKAERGFRSYGDMVRDALERLRQVPWAEPPALLLVDEYQDINPVQEAFLAALGARRTVIVGDPKQAIYGFRGGVPELLKIKLRQAAARGEAFRLPANHRSSAPVVDLANAFVRDVVPRLEPSSADPDGVQTHLGQGSGELRVALAAIPSPKRGSDLQAAAPWIAALARSEGWTAAGFAPAAGASRKRALLLPRRTGLPELRRALQARAIEPLVQSREGFWDSPGVGLLMALLEAVACPDAAVARFAVLRSPWVSATNAELLTWVREGTETGPIAEGLAWLASLATQTTQAVVAQGLARRGLLEFLSATEVHGALEPARARRNLERFLGWIPALSEVPALAWAELRAQRAFRDPGDAPAEDAAADLVVQTIHGSKGLEYDDVLLPMLANSVKGIRKGTIRQRPSVPGPLWVGWKLGQAQGPALKELQGEEARRTFREGLNLLYVGLTRARGRMALLQQWPVSKEDGTAACPPGGSERLEKGKPVQWHHVATDLAEAVPGLPRLGEPPAVARVQPLQRQPLEPPPERPAHIFPLAVVGLAGDSERVRKGIHLHALLREVLVRHAADPDVARAYLTTYMKSAAWPDAGELVAQVLHELASRGWDRLPRRTEYELPGAGRLGGRGRADLVLWEPSRQNPSGIHLVDFKLAASFTPETLALHRLQLKGYWEALAARHPEAWIEAWVVGLEGGGWIKVISRESA